MIRNIKDFCFDVAGRLIGGRYCYVNLDKNVCKELGGVNYSGQIFNCKFSDIERAQERETAVKLAIPLGKSERLRLIKAELEKGLPKEMSMFEEDLIVNTEGLNTYSIILVMEELKEGYIPVEERVKKSSLYKPDKPLEPQIRAFELAEGLWTGTKRIFGGFNKEDKEKILLPAIEETRRQFKWREKMMGRIRELLKFKPDESNKEVWASLVKNPEALEVWDSSPKDYPEGIKRIKKTPYGTEQQQIWEVIDKTGAGALISFYPNKKEVEMNSPHFEENE